MERILRHRLNFFLHLVQSEAFDGQFDLVGFFVGVEFDEGFEEATHSRGTRFDDALGYGLLLGFLSVADSLLALILLRV